MSPGVAMLLWGVAIGALGATVVMLAAWAARRAAAGQATPPRPDPIAEAEHAAESSERDAARVEAHLRDVGLPWRIADIPGDMPGAEGLLAFIAQDKKVSRGALTFILTHGIGRSFIARDVPASEVLSFMADSLAT